MVEGHLGHQALEPRAVVGGLAAVPLVFVDDHDTLGRPTKALGELGQSVLPLPRLAIFEDLLRRRLSYIDHRQTIQMQVADLGRRS